MPEERCEVVKCRRCKMVQEDRCCEVPYTTCRQVAEEQVHDGPGNDLLAGAVLLHQKVTRLRAGVRAGVRPPCGPTSLNMGGAEWYGRLMDRMHHGARGADGRFVLRIKPHSHG